MDFGFFSADQSAPHHFAHHGMILSDLFHSRRVQAICSAVAHVRDPHQTVGVEQQRDDGGPHAAEFRIVDRLLVNPMIGSGDRFEENVGGISGGRHEFLADGFSGDAAGGCAAAMAPHAVGDHEQSTPRRTVEDVAEVLVRVPPQADVTQRGDLDLFWIDAAHGLNTRSLSPCFTGRDFTDVSPSGPNASPRIDFDCSDWMGDGGLIYRGNAKECGPTRVLNRVTRFCEKPFCDHGYAESEAIERAGSIRRRDARTEHLRSCLLIRGWSRCPI